MIMVGCWLNLSNLPKMDRGNLKNQDTLWNELLVVQIGPKMTKPVQIDHNLTDKDLTVPKTHF